ncbi:MAG: 3'(2'),5'-bisphosphate nucleotidase CysQ [Pseudomonadota bacterium]
MPGPSDLDLIIGAVREAGTIARRFFEGDNKVWDKGSEGPVTEADIAVDTHLRETLCSARPAYGWLSEETEDTPARLSTTRLFIVDPIDGTRAFVKGEEAWAHSVAVVENGAPVAAAVYLPMMDKLYTATATGGARLNDTSLRVAAPDGRPQVLASRPAFEARHWPGGVPAVDRHFRTSLAYRLCLVADGSFDGMLTLRDSWEWDLAAGALIATEAGAVVSDRTGAPLRFNSKGRMTPGVVAASSAVHDDLTTRLKET